MTALVAKTQLASGHVYSSHVRTQKVQRLDLAAVADIGHGVGRHLRPIPTDAIEASRDSAVVNQSRRLLAVWSTFEHVRRRSVGVPHRHRLRSGNLRLRRQSRGCGTGADAKTHLAVTAKFVNRLFAGPTFTIAFVVNTGALNSRLGDGINERGMRSRGGASSASRRDEQVVRRAFCFSFGFLLNRRRGRGLGQPKTSSERAKTQPFLG